jgi:hypothetical protein
MQFSYQVSGLSDLPVLGLKIERLQSDTATTYTIFTRQILKSATGNEQYRRGRLLFIQFSLSGSRFQLTVARRLVSILM